MTAENVYKFYELLAKDKNLLDKVNSAGAALNISLSSKENFSEKDLAEIYRIIEPTAKKAGCPFTLADMKSYQKEMEEKISKEALSACSAGRGVCACALGGGGQIEGERNPCLCVGGGGGGEGLALKCFCFLGGGGG